MDGWFSLRDDRGARRSLAGLGHAARSTGIEPDVLATRGDMASIWPAFCVIGGVSVMLFGFAIPMFFESISLAEFVIAWIVCSPFVFLFGGVTTAFVTARAAWRSPRHARDAMLGHGLCPACVHGIDGIPPQPDGCVTCPECGAAWRVLPADATG